MRATIPPAENWTGALRSKRFFVYKSFEELYTDFAILVKIPRLESRDGYTKTKIRMYWHLREGMEAPGPSPEDVWSDYAGVWHFCEMTRIRGPPIGSWLKILLSKRQDL